MNRSKNPPMHNSHTNIVNTNEYRKMNEIVLTPASEIKIRPVEWIWKGWLAKGKFHILGGMAGTGKTNLALAMATIVTTGGAWPDGSMAPIGDVLIWSAEDDLNDTLAPRLRASGANMERIHFISGTSDGNTVRPFNPAKDIEKIKSTLEQIGTVSLIIFDPIVAVITGDGNNNVEVRRGLQPAVDLAESIGCAVLGITHFTKGTAGSNPLERITGSLAFGAVARVVMVAAQLSNDEEGDDIRILCKAKANITLDKGGFEYKLIEREIPECPGARATAVDWGERLYGSAQALLSISNNRDESANRGALDEAKDFLFDILKNGPLPASEITDRASAEGLSRSTLKRAKSDLGIRAHKNGMNGGWSWELSHDFNEIGSNFPKRFKHYEEGHPNTMSTFDGSDPLQDYFQDYGDMAEEEL